MGPWALALALLLATDVLAQTATPRVTVAPAGDMRLWSFGDCDRRFPYVNTDEHKECVRVVGSPEARDARALRICEVSYGRDREEVDRCKASYRTNKEKAAQDGVVSDAPAAAQAPPSEEMMRRVKVITAAAVEANRSAAPAQAPPPDEATGGSAVAQRGIRIIVGDDDRPRASAGRWPRLRVHGRPQEAGSVGLAQSGLVPDQDRDRCRGRPAPAVSRRRREAIAAVRLCSQDFDLAREAFLAPPDPA